MGRRFASIVAHRHTGVVRWCLPGSTCHPTGEGDSDAYKRRLWRVVDDTSPLAGSDARKSNGERRTCLPRTPPPVRRPTSRRGGTARRIEGGPAIECRKLPPRGQSSLPHGCHERLLHSAFPPLRFDASLPTDVRVVFPPSKKKNEKKKSATKDRKRQKTMVGEKKTGVGESSWRREKAVYAAVSTPATG